MAILPILIYPDPHLREQCSEVVEINDEVRRLMDDMTETMYAAPGIGLAAAQVGSPHRVIVVDIGEDADSKSKGYLYQLANPRIVSAHGLLEWEEGCLSIPDVREIVSRSSAVKVEALDRNGKKTVVEAEGLLAVCLQHEIDHLNGVLFIDHLSRLKRNLIKTKLRRIGRD